MPRKRLMYKMFVRDQTCERKWAEAELGRGRSWNAMQVQPNLSRPGNEKCRMACGGAHVRLPWLGLHTSTRSWGAVPCEGRECDSVSLLLKPALQGWQLLAVPDHTPCPRKGTLGAARPCLIWYNCCLEAENGVLCPLQGCFAANWGSSPVTGFAVRLPRCEAHLFYLLVLWSWAKILKSPFFSFLFG